MDANSTINPLRIASDSHNPSTGEDLWTGKTEASEKQSRPFIQKANESAQVAQKLKRESYAKQYAELRNDLSRLSLTRLYAKYRSEYNSWRRAHNPKTRQAGVVFDYVALGDFRNWLVHLGMRPSREYTADRIDSLKGYEPGNLRWASKKEQAENRRSTRRIRWGGISYTRPQFAAYLGIRYKRLCKQLERGWPLSRIVAAAGRAIDPVEDFQFGAPILEQEYWVRPDRYFALNRLDWLPCFYEDNANAATGKDVREIFRALAAESRQVQRRRYAERDAIRAAKQDELLKQIASFNPVFSPDFSPSTPARNDCTAVKPDAGEGQASMRRVRATKEEEKKNAKAFNDYAYRRVAQLVMEGVPIVEASRMASAEFPQKLVNLQTLGGKE